MSADSSFTFKSNKVTTMRVYLSGTGVTVDSEGGSEGQYRRERSIDFANVSKVTLHAYERKNLKTAALTFHPAQGQAVRLVGSSGGPIGGSEADLDGYYAAAQAVLTAFARARPDANVRLGRDGASTVGALIGLALSMGAGALAALAMSGGDSFAFAVGAAVAAVMVAFIGYARMGVGRKPHIVPVNSAIVRIADRSVARPTAT